jgi:DNA-binding CsgD family transcriptional regulator/pimeloyl-ACP methyl ester carboxylesterase
LVANQRIRFATALDGARIAYAVHGHGPALVNVGHWLTHLEYEWESPVWRHWLEDLGRSHRMVRYDSRETGLSSGGGKELSLDVWVEDLETVVGAAGLDHFPLLAMLNAGPVAIEYAVRHPDKVSALVLYGTFLLGRSKRGDTAQSRREAEALRTLMEISWGRDDASIRQLWSARFIPDASLEQFHWFNDLQLKSATADAAVRSMRVSHDIDVSDVARRVAVPTLVLHSRNDAMVPLENGYQVAASIPDASFVPLESRNHILLAHEPAWPRFLAAVGDFLGTEPSHMPRALTMLTARERQLLELMAAGLDNGAIAVKLVISPKTVRNHITHIFEKLAVANRSQAIVLARDAGLGGH